MVDKTDAKTADAATVGPAESLDNLSSQMERLTTDLFNWVERDSLSLLAAIAIGTALYLLLVLIRGWLRGRLDSYAAPGSLGWVALEVVSRTRSLFLIILSARIVTGFFQFPHTWTAFITFLFTVAAAFQGANWVRAFVLALVKRRAMEEEDATVASAMNVITVVLTVVIWAIAIIILLDNLGVNVTGLMAGLGIGGIAIGLAAQGIFSDLFAALSIIFDKPFRQGETIQVGGAAGVTGTVESIGMKTTRLRAVSGEIIVMSNTNLLNQQINNFAYYNNRRVQIALGVIYQTSSEKMRQIPQILKAIIDQRERCEFDRAHLVNLGAYSVDYELVFHVGDGSLLPFMEEREAVCLAILDTFAQHGIELAYPTQVEMQMLPDGSILDPRDEVVATKG